VRSANRRLRIRALSLVSHLKHHTRSRQEIFQSNRERLLRILLVAKIVFLLAFFAIAVALGPFLDSDAPAALVTGFTGIAAMAIQNAVQRVHFAHIPPTTLMTGNTTQVVLDAVDPTRPPFARAFSEPSVVSCGSVQAVPLLLCCTTGSASGALQCRWRSVQRLPFCMTTT
jgi:uncharacterized membrane protein YoaK (UPF0700 family)